MPGASPATLDWLESWSLPADATGRVVLAVACLLLVCSVIPRAPERLALGVIGPTLFDLHRHRRFLAVVAGASAFLSLGYLALYLEGGPRAPDAALYWIQGRALSHGRLAWAAPEPLASFHTAGLVLPSVDREAGPFPPGFPLLLAAGFLVGAPMVVGPLLAAAIALATWWLGREMAAASGEPADRTEATGRIAAALSLVCAALRYHTAETLPFGAAALGVAVVLAGVLRACRTSDSRFLMVAGGAVGALVAVHPPSAVAVGLVGTALAIVKQQSRKSFALAASAAIPGVCLLVAARRAAHTTLDDLLRAHLLDSANFEPLVVVAAIALVGRRRAAPTSWAVAVIAGQIAVVALAHLTATAAASGAASLAPVLPVEHALVAFALAGAFPHALGHAAAAALGLASLGFALHGAAGHRELATADGGRPRYDPDVPHLAGVARGLLFFEDDIGCELARDPIGSANQGVIAARLRGDDHDRLIYDLLAKPACHRYMTPMGHATVVVFTPPGELSDSWRFETESDWPVVAITGGSAEPSDERASCASGGRVLEVTPSASASSGRTASAPTAKATVELPLPPQLRRTWLVIPRVFERGTGAEGVIELEPKVGDAPLARWTWKDTAAAPSCIDLAATPVELEGDHGRAWLVVTASGGPVSVDRTILRAR